MDKKKCTRKFTKTAKTRDFRFNVQPSRLRKNSKEIMHLEQTLYENIRVNNVSLKSIYRGEELYVDLYSLFSKFDKEFVNFDYEWYIESKVFSYIHDVCSITTPPDYSITKSNKASVESVELLTNDLIEYSKSKGIKRISVKKHKAISEWFITYLNCCWTKGLLGLKYTRDKSFRNKYKVLNTDFSYDILIRLVDMLIDRQLTLSFTGNVLYGTRPMSMLVFNPLLYEMYNIGNVDIEVKTKPKDSIVVLNSEGEEVPRNLLEEEMLKVYDAGAKVFDKYHNMMENSTVDVNGYPIPEVWLRRILKVEMETDGRVFDNGSIQGKSKLIRSLIKIDKEGTVSLDFKAIHPAILLAWEGYSMRDHDPYPKLKNIEVDKKIINRFKKFYSIESYDPLRNIIKKLVLCLINADSVQAAVGSCYEDLKNDNLKKGTHHEHTMRYVGLPEINLHKVAEELLEHNHMIRKYFGVGIGNKLQWKDSEIIMHCLKVLTEKNIPCIPIHDAVICKVSDKVVVEKVMTEGFLKVVGSIENCIIEEE